VRFTVKSGSQETPGQAFTDEWGFRADIALKKTSENFFKSDELAMTDFKSLQTEAPFSSVKFRFEQREIPYYSVHGVGSQVNYIRPAKNVIFSSKDTTSIVPAEKNPRSYQLSAKQIGQQKLAICTSFL